MRSASSYRGAKKKAARDKGVPFSKFNEHYAKSRMFAAHELERRALAMTPEGAREALAIWARNGGRATAVSPPASAADLARMNAPPMPEIDPPPPIDEEKAVEQAKKITPADIDKAMESALTRWIEDRRPGPMPLSKLFAARARTLGWVENVEFVEE